MPNFYCKNIHNNLRITGSTQTGLRLLPCCVYQTDKIYSTLDEYYSSSEFANLQTTTDWLAGCNTCKNQETQGQRSYRIDANNFFGESTDKRVELFPSNVCNLKCFMCDKESSSALAQEQYALGEATLEDIKEFNISEESLDIISKISNLKFISLIGGEFFLTKNNLEFLDFAIKNNISLRVVTNATTILDQHLSKLKLLDNLELQISIDGYEQSYEFMRYPAKWDTFSNNVKRLTGEINKTNLNFHFVVQPLNVQYLIPTLHWTNQFYANTRITNLVAPEYLSWSILNNKEKNAVCDYLQTQLDTQYLLTRQQKEFILNLITTIKQSDYSFQNRHTFIQQFSKILKHRKIDLSTVKEHLGMIESVLDIGGNG